MKPPPVPIETASILKKAGTVVLDSSGNGVLQFDPDNANQRWEVTGVVVSTNQSATATVVPVVTLAENTVSLATMSPGAQRGSSWNGNQVTFSGLWKVGECDYLTVIFAPPTGTSGASLSGVKGTAIVTGTKYTRRS